MSNGDQYREPTHLIRGTRPEDSGSNPEVLFHVGPYRVVRGLVRAPLAWVVEALDANDTQVLLQLIHCRALTSPGEREQRKHLEQRIVESTVALFDEPGISIQAHGHVDREDQSWIIYWALPWRDDAERLGRAHEDLHALEQLFVTASALTERIARRHRDDRLDPLLTEQLVLIESRGAELIGVPIFLAEDWLANEMPSCRLAPEERPQQSPGRLGDIWRLGQTLLALSSHFNSLPDTFLTLLERMASSHPSQRPQSIEEVASALHQVRAGLDGPHKLRPATASAAADTDSLSPEDLARLMLDSMGDSSNTEAAQPMERAPSTHQGDPALFSNIRRRKATFVGEDEVPDWAFFFDQEGYKFFMTAVRDDLRERTIEFIFGTGMVRIQQPDAPPQYLGLHHLARACFRSPQTEWRRKISTDFDMRIDSGDGDYVETIDENISARRLPRAPSQEPIWSASPRKLRGVEQGATEIELFVEPPDTRTIVHVHDASGDEAVTLADHDGLNIRHLRKAIPSSEAPTNLNIEKRFTRPTVKSMPAVRPPQVQAPVDPNAVAGYTAVGISPQQPEIRAQRPAPQFPAPNTADLLPPPVHAPYAPQEPYQQQYPPTEQRGLVPYRPPPQAHPQQGYPPQHPPVRALQPLPAPPVPQIGPGMQPGVQPRPSISTKSVEQELAEELAAEMKPARSSPIRNALALCGVLLTVGLVAYLINLADKPPPLPEVESTLLTPSNEVLLRASPPGAIVVSERGGQILGTPPLRFLVPTGKTIAVLVSADGFEPQKLVLPERGLISTALRPLPAKTERCKLGFTGAIGTRLESVAGPIKINESLELKGAGVLRTVGDESLGRAWMVFCPQLGGQAQVELVPHRIEKSELHILKPKGVFAYIDGQPAGQIPLKRTASASFTKIRAVGKQDKIITRWVPLEGEVEVVLPDPELSPDPLPAPPPPPPKLEEPPPPPKKQAPKRRRKRRRRLR